RRVAEGPRCRGMGGPRDQLHLDLASREGAIRGGRSGPASSGARPSFGEWLLDDLSATYYGETEGRAPERAARVAERLQRDRAPADRLREVVFFGTKEAAITDEGPHVFISGRRREPWREDAACAGM